jgi:hypothetical protein
MHGDNHGPRPEDAAGPRHRLDRFVDAPGRHPAIVGASAAGTKSPTMLSAIAIFSALDGGSHNCDLAAVD